MSNTKLLPVTIENSNDQLLTLRPVKVKREIIKIKWIASAVLAVIIVVLLIGLTTVDHQRQSDHHVLLPDEDEIIEIMYDNQTDFNQDKTVLRFRGNDSLEPEYFKLLESDGRFLMVGARNAVYNISLKSLKVEQKIEWPSSEHHVDGCKMKGKSSEDCHNYIRVMIKQSNSKSLVCGTNAFRPTCRQYEHSTGHGHLMIREFNGYGISPYDPRDNSTALYLADTDELYAGTVSDFGATDPLIYRRALSDSTSELRTQRHDLKCLNDPNFVSSFDDEDHVYFWFRETAAEHNGGASGPSRDKAVFGRIARVCKRDRGGPGSFSNRWTSFVKARLNCSLPGSIPFYFNELQATSAPIYTTDGSQLVYALMTTPPGPLQMSAVCAFRMEDVIRIFEFGQFKSQKGSRSLGLPVAKNKEPKIRPSCHNNSQTLSEEVAGFVMRNSLMADAVPNFFNAPLFVDNSTRTKYSQIAVHPQVQAASGRRFDVVFLGTDDGRVVKMVNMADGRSAKTILIETVKVFGLLEPVRNLLIDTKSMEEGRLIALSKEEVRSISLHHCANQLSCSSCVRLRDPYCGWDMENAKCVARINGDWIGDFVQNVLTGRSNLCYEEDRILLIGGAENEESMEYFYPDDPHKNTLLNVTLITSRSSHTSVLFNETTVLTIGGRHTRTPYKWKDLRSTEIFNALTNETYPFTDLTVTRLCYPGAAVLNGIIHVCGGCKGTTGWLDTALDSCQLLNPENKRSTQMSSMIKKRAFFRLLSHHDFLYAIGGKTDWYNANRYAKSMERYNVVENKWHMLAPMSVGRAGLAATILSHSIYACGGISGTGVDGEIIESSCEKYNIQNNSWQPISSMGEKRADFILLAFRGKLIAIGGSFDKNGTEVYDPEIDKWTPMPDKTIKGRYAGGGVVL